MKFSSILLATLLLMACVARSTWALPVPDEPPTISAAAERFRTAKGIGHLAVDPDSLKKANSGPHSFAEAQSEGTAMSMGDPPAVSDAERFRTAKGIGHITDKVGKSGDERHSLANAVHSGALPEPYKPVVSSAEVRYFNTAKGVGSAKGSVSPNSGSHSFADALRDSGTAVPMGDK